jgi:ribosomal peptide maturation radical SAM protein 1
MFRICLVNMPFSDLGLPSIGLTQLKQVLETELRGQVSVDLLYVNQDFARLIGVEPYSFVANSAQSNNAGLGDWLFRQSAFPELPENSEEYFKRFFPAHGEESMKYKQYIQKLRMQLDGFLDDIILRYKLDEAHLVGFTSMFMQNVASFAMAKRIKKRNPKAITVMGGANCEAPMGKEIVNNTDFIDFVFSGPALLSLPSFIRHQINNQPEKCHAINGVFSRLNCSSARPMAGLGDFKPLREIGDELDIDEFIELHYGEFLDTLKKNFPNKEVEPYLQFETSRGCWWGEKAHCTFCGLNGISMKYRSMRPDNAVRLIESLFDYSDRCSRLQSVDNILPKNYFKEVFPYLNTPPNMSLFYEVKADLSKEDLKVLAKARVTMIQPGIESLATSTLKLMKKGTSAFQNLKLLKNCMTYDIDPVWNLLIGFPGEGEEVYKKYVDDIPTLAHLPPPGGVFPVRFDRYSPYFMRAREYELDLTPMDYYALIYPFKAESLANLAYYFSDRNYGAQYAMTMSRWIRKIRERYEGWKLRWQGNPETRARLFLNKKAESSVVYDSRLGDAVEHSLSDVGVRMLRYLDEPRRKPDLAAHLSDAPVDAMERELVFLQERGLLFQEGDRYLSLVISDRESDRVQ